MCLISCAVIWYFSGSHTNCTWSETILLALGIVAHWLCFQGVAKDCDSLSTVAEISNMFVVFWLNKDSFLIQSYVVCNKSLFRMTYGVVVIVYWSDASFSLLIMKISSGRVCVQRRICYNMLMTILF